MTPSEKLIKAIRLAMGKANIDGLTGLTGASIVVNFRKPGEAEVDIRPIVAGTFDLTAVVN